MKSLCLWVLAILAAHLAPAQIKAVTETGDDVFLYDDGTWRFAQEKAEEPTEISTNAKSFEKDAKSTFQLKSSVVPVGVWLDAKKWSFKKGTSNEDAEYEFQLKGEDLFGMMISEKTEIPLTTLRKIALDNARNVAPDVRSIKEEYRTVNGLKVLLLQMEGTMEGIKFIYYGYYYTSPEGTVQFILYTSPTLFNRYLKDAETMLNGFSKL